MTGWSAVCQIQGMTLIFARKLVMSTVLIARFKNKREASSAAKLIEKYQSSVRLFKESQLEDFFSWPID